MRIEIRIEDDRPILFFPDEVQNDKTINCWTVHAEHATASRSYMRGLAKPTTPEQLKSCWRALNIYSSHVDYLYKHELI
jgi:hypothetical protein